MPDVLTPQVAQIHWDDILSEFSICASFQLKTPFGNKPNVEECVTASTLAGALTAIINAWGAAPSGVDKVTFLVGDPSLVTDALTALAAVAYAPTSLPTPPGGNVGPDDTLVEYDGVTDSWGATTP